EDEFAVADPHAIAGMQGPRRLQQLLVEVGAVGRMKVLDDDAVALLVDAGVTGGGEGVLQADLRAVAAPEDEVPVEVVDHSLLVARRTLDDEPWGAPDVVDRAEGRGRVHAGRVGRCLRSARFPSHGRAAPQVAASAAGNPQEEQGHDGQEAELQRDRGRMEAVHPSSNRASVEPSSTRSPACRSWREWIAWPLTSTPLV